MCDYESGKRKTRQPSWLPSAQRGLCDRLRKRLEVSVDDRSVRRRRFRAGLCALPAAARPAGDDHGICHGKSLPGKPGPDVSQAGKTGAEVAYPRIPGPGRKPCPDGVLHGCDRLDDVLLCTVCHRQERGPRLCGHDYESRGQRDLSCHRGGAWLRRAEL